MQQYKPNAWIELMRRLQLSSSTPSLVSFHENAIEVFGFVAPLLNELFFEVKEQSLATNL